jgi:integrase
MKQKFTLRLVANKQRIRNGYAVLRLYVSLNGTHGYTDTGVRWRKEFFNEGEETILKGNATTKDYNQALQKIQDLRNKIESIILKNEGIKFTEIKNLLSGKVVKEDFYLFYAKTAEKRAKNNEITFETYKYQIGTLKVLKAFKSRLFFDEINLGFLEGFKSFLLKRGYRRNTILGRLKDFRTYLNQAKKQNINFDYPFSQGFKMPKSESRIEFLHESEFLKLKEYFESENIYPYHYQVLRGFLFCCYTGLRISDLLDLRGRNITNNKLTFSPQKTRFSETKKFSTIEIPLHPFCKKLIGETKPNNFVFDELPAKQKINQRLKEIAKILGIEKNISTHYARHTFATRFLSANGNIEVLREFLGHEDLKTTLIYTHIEPARKERQILQMT